VQLVVFLLGIERERAGQVVIAGDGGQFGAALLKEGALDLIAPFDRVEDANRPLGLYESIAQRANHALVGRELALGLAVRGRDLVHAPASWKRHRTGPRFPGSIRRNEEALSRCHSL